MELSGKVALITGATSGIGAETATLFAAEGAEVIVAGRHSDVGAQIVTKIQASGGRARYIHGDLTDRSAVRAIAEQAGAVDVLVNNAAFAPMAATVDQDSESFDQTFETNVRALYFLTAAVARGMVARGRGSIVNVTTMAAHIAMPGLSVYGASKAAVESLTRTWAAEFAPSGVRVNSVSPGPTATERAIAKRGDGLNAMGRTTLLTRAATTSEIASAILFLASDRSSYITGTSLATDGGRTAI